MSKIDDLLAVGAIAGNDPELSSTLPVSRLHMYQGTPDEAERFGPHEVGEWIDTIEGESLGHRVAFAPIAARAAWAKWDDGSSMPQYVYDDYSQVPPEDREWIDGRPPVASKIITMVGWVGTIGDDGSIAWRDDPVAVAFKRTGLAAARKIQQVEVRRSMQKKGPGIYYLTSKPARSIDNKPYQKMHAEYARKGLLEDETLRKLIEQSDYDVAMLRDIATRPALEAASEPDHADKPKEIPASEFATQDEVPF